MDSDMPFWDSLRDVSAWSRHLKFWAILVAAVVGLAIWGFEYRKQVLEARRDGPRRIPENQRQQFQTWLQPHQGTDIWFINTANDQEAALFRQELASVFTAANWVVNRAGIHAMGTNEPLTQVEILYYWEDSDAIKAAAHTAIRMFNRLGYNYRVTPVRMANGANFNPGTIVVKIGQR